MLFDEVRKAFDTAAEWLHTKKKFTADMLAERPAQNLMQATNDVLQQAVNRGITHEVPEELTAALEQNTFIFSGFKTYHELREASLLLKDENGGFKPFERYLSDVQKINNTYNRSYLEAEYNYAVHSTQMAVKWHDFEKDGDSYLLQYRTAGDGKVREEHAVLHNTTLEASDPFWNDFLPPNGWNCRCTVVQVRRGKYPASDSSTSIANGRAATEKTPSFRFNPGKQRKCFPDNVSYLKHAGQNRKERDKVEEKCRLINKEATIKKSKDNLINEITEINLNNTKAEIIYTAKGLKHATNDMGNEKGMAYWLKNEILPNIDKYLKKAKYVGRKISDPNHNTNKETVKLKKNSDYFYYLETTLPDGQKCYLHLGHYKTTYHVPEKAGKYYIYSITTYIPKNLESI